MKELFSYNLKTKVRADITEETEPGKKVITTKIIEKPVRVIIKSPGRAEITESQNIYQITFSDGIRRGLLPRILISKIFRESNGILTQNELKDLEGVSKKIVDIQTEYEKIKESADLKDKNRVKELLLEFSAANQKLEQLEEVNSSLFVNSAESIAGERQLIFNILFLSHIEVDGKIIPLVNGNTVDEKLENFDKILDAESESFEAAEKAKLFDQILVINSEFLRLLNSGKITKEQFPFIKENIESRANPADLAEEKDSQKSEEKVIEPRESVESAGLVISD